MQRQIEPKDKVKYLAAVLEQTRAWESMVNSILQKANTRLVKIFIVNIVNTRSSYEVGSESDITPCIEMDKPLVVYRFW